MFVGPSFFQEGQHIGTTSLERVHFQLPIMEFAHLSSHSVEGETIDCLQHCLEQRNRIEFAVNVDNLQAYLV